VAQDNAADRGGAANDPRNRVPASPHAEASADAQTAPFAPGGRETVSLAAATGPMGAATAPMDTGALAGANASTAMIAGIDRRGNPAADRTGPIRRLSGAAAATGPFAPSPASGAETVSLPGQRTGPMGIQTSPMGHPSHAATAPMIARAGGTGPIPGATDAAALVAARGAVKRDPANADAFFKLAVLLHRAGENGEARETLRALASVYEARGQASQAARIVGMLGGPGTGPVGTGELTPAPVGSATATAPLRQTSRLGGQGTGLLRQTGPIGKAAREQAAAPPPPPPPPFPPEALIFTDPLPGEDDLGDPMRAAVAQSTADLRAGHHLAALDSALSAIAIDPDYLPVFIRVAELNTVLHRQRKARTQAETLLRLVKADEQTDQLWMVYRILLHTAENDLPSLRRLVELLIDGGQTDQASYYASKLIRLLDEEGLNADAVAYSTRLCSMIPGDTRAALESAVLQIKGGNPDAAIDTWESAVAAGADEIIAKASLAALMTTVSEDDHWRTLADVASSLRERADPEVAEAYARTASALPASPNLLAGHGTLLVATGDGAGRALLSAAAGDRGASPFARAVAAVVLGRLLREAGPEDEYVAAVRTAIQLVEDAAVANHPAWSGLVDAPPRFEDLSLELGEVLLARGDSAGAAEVLTPAHARCPHHDRLCRALAEASFRSGQLGAALKVLDELAAHHRKAGDLEAMAAVLRQMSQLAPNNIKVKSRLIDTYLQRGFVAEARAELIQRADLQARSGLIQDTVVSLERAADLSWTVGLADETFALYDRIIELAPSVVAHRHSLVTLYLQMGRLAEAAAHQRAIVDISLREDRRHEAIAALHQVIGLTPDDTSAYYQLADLLSAIGEYGQAEKVYKRILAISPDDVIASAKAMAMAGLREPQSA